MIYVFICPFCETEINMNDAQHHIDYECGIVSDVFRMNFDAQEFFNEFQLFGKHSSFIKGKNGR